MEYQELTIDVESATGGGFEARVVDSPFHDSFRVPFQRPIERPHLEALMTALNEQADPGNASAVQLLKERSLPAPRHWGETLYQALFQNKLAELLSRCRGALSASSGSGLRIRLRFLLNDPDAAYLAALPWEMLCHDEYLAIDRRTPVVRDIRGTGKVRPWTPLQVEPPLRILVVDALTGRDRACGAREVEGMTAALGNLVDSGSVELIQPAEPTPEAVRDVLLSEETHILHFIGHGGYDAASGAGAVRFPGLNGKEDQVEGDMLADYLKEDRGLRLVVLNSCQTARHAGSQGAPYFFGVASAVLERTGVPAVVAHQYAISHGAANDFSEAFYHRLAAGDDVDTAVTEARLRLRHRGREWATPVLFLGPRDGKLFHLPKEERRRAVRVVRPSRPEEEPVRLGIRSIDGWGRDMKDRTDHLLDLTELFDDRYILHPEDWQSKVFPRVRDFLRERVVERRPLLLDFAAHSSIAFAAGWLLEAKSGLDVRVRQRTQNEGEFVMHPKDGTAVGEGPLWLERTDTVLDSQGPDIALAVEVSQPTVAEQVKDFVERKGLPVGRVICATIAPEPGQKSVRGGGHALRLAQALLPRVRQRKPHERSGQVHLFCAAPNAFTFYLGQLSRSFGKIALYEHPFGAADAYGKYQKSIELAADEEKVPDLGGW